jgi:hypothetical protein
MANKLTVYAKRGNKKVIGWLSPIAIDVIVELANLQKQMGIRGPVCEIGVHHGRLFILLHLLTEGHEKSVAYDLFERQDENMDKSGHGDKSILQKNLKRHHCDLNRITINTENSLNLTPDRVINDCGDKVRLFSIDGGHTAETTFNDLSLAAKTLCEGGIIILDDFFNEAWPGVAAGTCKYLLNNTGLSPIVITGNKFIFTNNKKLAESYIDGISQLCRWCLSKKYPVFGSEVLIFIPIKNNIKTLLAKTSVWRSIRNKPIGKFIKRTLKG